MLPSNNFYSSIELNHLSEQVLVSLPNQVAIVNSDGDIVAQNQKWTNQRTLINEKWAFPLLGENILQCLQSPLTQNNDYALRFIVAYKSVLSGNEKESVVHFPVHLEEKKWHSLTITMLDDKEHALVICNDISSEMAAKSNLNQSSIRFQKQFQNKLYGIIIADENYTILEANKTASQILRNSLKDIKKRPLNYFFDIEFERNKSDRADEVFLGETTITDFDGKLIPVELSVSAYIDHNRKKVFNCSFKDISDRKKAELSVQNNERKYREQFDNSLDGIIIAEQGGAIYDVNPAACALLGYSYDELIYQNREAIIDNTNPLVINAIQQRDKKGFYSGEFEFIHKNGSKVPVEIRNRLVEKADGKKQSMLSFHSIDERISTEKKFRKLFNASPNAIVVLDTQGVINDSNESFSRIFGFSNQELVNNFLADFILRENQRKDYETLFNKVLDGEHIKLETSRINKEGTIIPVTLSLTPVIENSKVVSVFCIYTDVTDQIGAKKTIEKQLREKEVLLHEIHHRVKNNLAIISGLIGLEGLYSNDEKLQNQLELTQSRIHSIAKIHELLYKSHDFSNIDFQEYTNQITEAFSLTSKYSFKSIGTDPIYLNVNQAVPCGILINEITSRIISNARTLNLKKHTVQYNTNLTNDIFTVRICEQEKTNIFDFSESQKNKLGSQLISVLLKQLDARIEFTEAGETCISISFKKKDNRGAHSSFV